jgi:glycosyltransferase involved in cell wall biosynthesis
MKILYDYQTFQNQRFGGISRYFFELITRFQRSGEVEASLPIKFSNNEYLRGIALEDGPVRPIPNFMGKQNFHGKGKLERLRNIIAPKHDRAGANRKLSLHSIAGGDFDIFHPTYYDDYYLETLNGKPFVLTVYDLIYEMFPSEFSTKGSKMVLSGKKKVIPRAARIIAISESTKKDLVKIYGIDQKRVKVIHLACSLPQANPKTEPLLRKRLPETYLLFVGTRTLYKNFTFFIESITEMLLNNPALKVVCTGESFDSEEKKFIARHGLNDSVIQVFAGESELGYLYENAVAFVFPSLYEGFGIPVLEAFSRRCPAILSNTSSLPEVGGDAAEYFDPSDAASIRNAVAKVISSEALRSELKEKGEKRIREFSWEKTLEKTKLLYEDVLAGRIS